MNFEQQQSHKEKQKELQDLDASKRPERTEDIIKFLDKTNAYHFFHDLEHGKDKINFEKFKSLLTRLNGIARDIPIKQREFDGKNVEISGGFLGETVLPPSYEDKEGILELAFRSTNDLNPEDNAYMVPAVINALHMFNDGNGRTSRIIHLLLNSKDEESFKADLRKALSADGRFDSVDINPGLIDNEIEKNLLQQSYGWEFGRDEETGEKYAAHERVRPVASAEYRDIDPIKEDFQKKINKFEKLRSADTRYILTATVEALNRDRYNSILMTNKSNREMISPLKMEILTDQEWEDIFNFYYDLKKEHIQTLIWIFKYPDKYKNPDDVNETMRDLFIRKIQEDYKENNK